MTSDDVFEMIVNHEMYIEEVNHIKNLYKGITTTKKQDIALKASIEETNHIKNLYKGITTTKSKKKQIMIESSSEEEDDDKEKEYDEYEMALFIRKLNKYISKRRSFNGDKKEKTWSKRVCYNYGKC
jgi:hypothetical protein